jgi:hypothetical protein
MALSILALVLFISGLLSTLVYESATDQKVTDLLEQAKQTVEPPELPPKPQGTTETIYEEQFATITIPYIKCRGLKCRKDDKEIRKLVARNPVQKFVGPTTEEVKNWEATVARLESDYQKSLQREVQRLQDESEAEEKARREEIKDWVGIVGGVVSAVFTIATFVLALAKYKKETVLVPSSVYPAPPIAKTASDKKPSPKAGSKKRKR